MKMKSPNIKNKSRPYLMYYAVLEETGELVPVDAVERGLACGCVCPLCGTRLEARKGEKNAHHFAHDRNYKCLYGAEIAVYKEFCELLKEEGNITLPAVTFGMKTLSPMRSFSFSKVELCVEDDVYPPELFCWFGEKRLRIILDFENYYNQSDEARLKKYGKENDIAVVVIPVKNFDDLKNQNLLREYIKNLKGKWWLFNQKQDEAERAVSPIQSIKPRVDISQSVSEKKFGLGVSPKKPAGDSSVTEKVEEQKREENKPPMASERDYKRVPEQEMEIYKEFCKLLKEEGGIFLPPVKVGSRIFLPEKKHIFSKVELCVEDDVYSPELFCWFGEKRLRVVLDFENFYDQAGKARLKKYGEANNIDVIIVHMKNFYNLKNPRVLRRYIQSSENTGWLWNQEKFEEERRISSTWS